MPRIRRLPSLAELRGSQSSGLFKAGRPVLISSASSCPWRRAPVPLSLLLLTVRTQRVVFASPGGLFFWGATNTSRESTMYPKTVQDLCGWRIRSLACGYVAVSGGEQDCPPPGGVAPQRCLFPGGSAVHQGSMEGRGCACPRRGLVLLSFGGLVCAAHITDSKVYLVGNGGFRCSDTLARKI